MRALFALGLLIVLTACSGDPAKYGITGPGTQPVPVANAAEAPEAQPVPGVTTLGSSNYGPSIAPSTGASGFFGYNN